MLDPKEEIKHCIDIVDLIGEYLQIKQAGSVSFKALCPFHGEKTPSFHISRDKQIWHCFGCGEGGDCFSFVMKMEGMDFPEALRHLGQKAGVEVQRFSTKESNEKQRVLALNELAGKFFRAVLKDSTSAAPARAYVAKRGITPELEEKFGLGFAPDTWDTLAGFLKKRGFTDMDGEKSGVLLRRRQGEGMIDRFRNRLMIPLRNHHGHTVGFTGRVLANSQQPAASSQDGPKYMNSPETPVYHKGSLLYGLDFAKPAIKEKGSVVIVEGNLDVIASHKAGVENVVASSGTALTEEQLILLKRFTTTLIFSFDSDAAGFKAAHRGITLARGLGLDVRVAVLPPEAGKDPDEAVQKNPDLWKKAVSKTVPIMQYYIDTSARGRNLSNVDDKKAVSTFLLPELSRITEVVEREHWLQVIADLLQTDIHSLRGAIRIPGALPTPRPVSSTLKETAKISQEERALRLLFGLFLHDSGLRPEIDKHLAEHGLTQEPLSYLYKEALAEYHLEHSPPTTEKPERSLFSRTRDRISANTQGLNHLPLLEAITLEAETLADALSSFELRGQITQLTEGLRRDRLHRRRVALQEQIRRAERAGDQTLVQQLIREYNESQEK